MVDNSFVEYVKDLLSSYGFIRARSMFGGYGIYCDNVIFAIIINDELYFKSDQELAKYFSGQGSSAFTYESKGKIVTMSYWKVPSEIIENEESLKIWFNKSMNVATKKK